jgi:hypothetical protein
MPLASLDAELIRIRDFRPEHILGMLSSVIV